MNPPFFVPTRTRTPLMTRTLRDGPTSIAVPWGARSGLTRDEFLRSSRHLIMPEVTLEGQLRLKRARVLCVGAGGLGSPMTLYLAAAGVGTIGLVEHDTVDLTNIQRQILYATADVGKAKLETATNGLHELHQ